MKSLFTLYLCLAITVALTGNANAQCNTGQAYAWPQMNTVMQGNAVGLQLYFYNSYTNNTWPDSKFYIALTTDNGSSWTQITQVDIRNKTIYNSYYYENISTGYNYMNGYYYMWTVPTTVKAGKYQVGLLEVPNNAKQCTVVRSYGTDLTIERGCNTPKLGAMSDITACQGSAVTVKLDAPVEPGYILYEWYKDGKPLTITKTPVYTFDPITTSNAGSYYVIVSDICGKSATTNTFKVSVLTPGIITSEPVGKTVCEGSYYTISVNASGAPLTYAWFKDGQLMPGVSGTSLTIPSATKTDEGEYQVIVTGGCGDPDTSQKVTIAVPAKPVFNEQLQGGLFCQGTKVVIAPNVTGTILAYQWYLGDKPLIGKTSRNLTFDAIQARDNGTYWVEVSVPGSEQSGCPAFTKSNRVFVGAYEAPVIKEQPVGVDACVGTDQQLTVEADGTDLAYQWFLNGTAIPNSNNYSLALNGIKANQAGTYSVTITGACGYFSESSVATVNVFNKPSITLQPMPATAKVGESVTLSVEATEAQEIIWLHNEKEVARGTNGTYVISKATMNDAGFYTALVKNVCSGEESVTVPVTIIDPESLVPTIAINSSGIDVGDAPFSYPITYTATGVVSNPGNVPITVSGYSISGTNASEFSVSNTGLPYTLAPGASHDVTITYTPGAVAASNATLTVQSDATQGTSTVSVMGRGVILYSTDQALNFGTVDKQQSTIKCINITNTSNKDVTIDAITITGTNSSEFTITTALPITIAPGAVTELCVQFTPETPGDRSASLAIMSSSGGNSTVSAFGVCVKAVSVTEDALAAGMSVYPNPTASAVTINTGTVEHATITIVDAQGAVVNTITTMGAVSVWNLHSATGAPVANGSYTIVVSNEAGAQYHMTLRVVR